MGASSEKKLPRCLPTKVPAALYRVGEDVIKISLSTPSHASMALITLRRMRPKLTCHQRGIVLRYLYRLRSAPVEAAKRRCIYLYGAMEAEMSAMP
jgi:hypothetical protein